MTKLDQKNAIKVLNLDFSKAFDKADHNLLLGRFLNNVGWMIPLSDEFVVGKQL